MWRSERAAQSVPSTGKDGSDLGTALFSQICMRSDDHDQPRATGILRAQSVGCESLRPRLELRAQSPPQCFMNSPGFGNFNWPSSQLERTLGLIEGVFSQTLPVNSCPQVLPKAVPNEPSPKLGTGAPSCGPLTNSGSQFQFLAADVHAAGINAAKHQGAQKV